MAPSNEEVAPADAGLGAQMSFVIRPSPSNLGASHGVIAAPMFKVAAIPTRLFRPMRNPHTIRRAKHLCSPVRFSRGRES